MIKKTLTNGCSWIEAVRDNPQYNFVAVAYTPWHAISIDSLILYLQHSGNVINAAIIITSHPQTGWAIDETFFTNTCSTFYADPSIAVKETPTITTKEKLYRSFKNILFFFKNISNIKNKKNIYYVTNCFPNMHIVHNLHYNYNKFVTIAYSDEGVASYMGTLKDPESKLLNKSRISSYIIYLNNYILGNKLYGLTHKSVNGRLLKKNIFGLSVNKKMLPYYTSTINNLYSQKKRKNIQTKSNAFIICTTAWQREEIKKDEDLKVLKQICKYLNAHGQILLLKTHPRDSFFKEKIEYLNCEPLDDNGLPLECICSEIKPAGIISFSSTVLITANILWNIPTYCISNLLNKKNIGNIYIEEIERFKKTFTGFTYFINRESDINLP